MKHSKFQVDNLLASKTGIVYNKLVKQKDRENLKIVIVKIAKQDYYVQNLKQKEMKKILYQTASLLLLLFIIVTSCKSKSYPKEKTITENGKEYISQDSIVVNTSDGAEIALLVIRNKEMKESLPTILHHTIYTRENDYKRALLAASQGYVGVVSYTRGKAWSSSEIVPYEFENEDVNTVIEWIVKQPWSNGEVGMQGGSYTGFTQWVHAY